MNIMKAKVHILEVVDDGNWSVSKFTKTQNRQGSVK